MWLGFTKVDFLGPDFGLNTFELNQVLILNFGAFFWYP